MEINRLDPHIQTVIKETEWYTRSEQGSLLAGTILPRGLSRALTSVMYHGDNQNAQRRGFKFTVTLLVLAEIISAYRPRGKKVWWSGPAFQINPVELGAEFDCSRFDISRALKTLEDADLIKRFQRASYNNSGNYLGKASFAIPNIAKITALLSETRRVSCCSSATQEDSNSNSPSPSNATPSKMKGNSPHVQRQLSPNGSRMSQLASTEDSSRGVAAEVDYPIHERGSQGKPLDESSMRAQQALASAAQSAAVELPEKAIKNDLVATKAQVPVKTVALDARSKADQFINFWMEAIERMALARGYRADRADRNALIDYFGEKPHITASWLLSVAITAWDIFRDSDNCGSHFWRCSRSTKINDFIHHLAGIQAEIHRANKEPWSYLNLRRLFTEGELSAVWSRMVIGNTGTIEPEDHPHLWENRRTFQLYYTNRNRALPADCLDNRAVEKYGYRREAAVCVLKKEGAVLDNWPNGVRKAKDSGDEKESDQRT